jgi:hypothetical protein
MNLPLVPIMKLLDNVHKKTYFTESILILSSNLCLGLPSVLLSGWVLNAKSGGGEVVYAAHPWKEKWGKVRWAFRTATETTCPVLRLSTLASLICGEEWVLWNFSIYDFLHPSVASSLFSLCINILLRLYLQVPSTYKHRENSLEFIWKRPLRDVSKQQRDASCHGPHLKQSFRTLPVGLLCSEGWLRGTCPARHANGLTLIAVKFDFGRKMKRKKRKKRNVWVSFPFAYNWSWIAVTKAVAICNSDFIVPPSFGQPQSSGRPCT